MKNCSRFLSFRRNLSFIFLLTLIFSCKEKQDLKLTGKYDFVEDYQIPIFTNDGDPFPPPPPKKNLGFNFYSKDSCESNEEYFDGKIYEEKQKIVRLGRITNFKIADDSLKIYNKSLLRWKSYAILHIDENNLTLFDGTFVESYAKKIKHIDVHN